MPDWFYRTVSRPLLFTLPAVPSRDVSLGFMGTLARLPLGPHVIDLLGHMRADPRLARTVFGARFPSPVGLGPMLDGRAEALPALARFGVGFVDVGPVTMTAREGRLERATEAEAILASDPPPGLSLDEAAARLNRGPRLGVPVLVRLTPATPDEARQMVAALAGAVTAFSIEGETAPTLAAAAEACDKVRRPWLLALPADAAADAAAAACEAARRVGAAGVQVDGYRRDGKGQRTYGLAAYEPARATVARVRQRWPEAVIVAGGGVHDPSRALGLAGAGADLVETDTGLVYSGPGLPKRINEAWLATGPGVTASPSDGAAHPPGRSWFWIAALGGSMFGGGLLALAIAMTRVVLPYDEAFVGMTRDQLHAINPRLLAFMAHDRICLAGAMVAVGILYLALSHQGIRRGWHWAHLTTAISALAGFASFFLFLGFGYFDPFHAFVSAILFQFVALSLHADLGPPPVPAAPDLEEDGRWRRSQWGQLLLLLHSAGLVGAGLVISTVGITQVFVHEDLEFMETTAQALHAANPRLLPLVAHDRASFGGMLLSVGLAMLFSTLWGFRRGTPWLFWALLAAGLAGYAGGIGVHLVVGYTSPMHLLPAFAGLGAFLTGLALSRGYLCDTRKI